mgnify:CR=1 FL=1
MNHDLFFYILINRYSFMHSVDQDGNLQTMYTNDREMAIPTGKRILECMHHPFEIEFIPRKVIDKYKKEQTNKRILAQFFQPILKMYGLNRKSNHCSFFVFFDL